MKKKQFKTESKKILDMMINSIYTNKEIFLRELISNASDAIDKLNYRSLTDKKCNVKREDFAIWIIPDKDTRTLKIIDNGIGMSEEDLENNLGTIAKSGSELFKESMDEKHTMSIIGQFGVGFYSAFMVSDQVSVKSRSIDNKETYLWTSRGIDGYSIEKVDDDISGTEITLHIKENTEETQYDEFLDTYFLEGLIKKYSDYIHYPIKMKVLETVTNDDKKSEEKEIEKTINSMIPLWKKDKKDVSEEEYNDFYTDKFYDYEKPLRVIRSVMEGRCSYQTLLFIPSHAPFNYYSKDYEKGLQLYSRGVMIMEKCKELLPDYFSFVKGIVDSEDISLNISRETLQENHQIELIAKSLESKIKKELEIMLKESREDYESFFKDFGTQLKFGIYTSYGMKKDVLADLLLFTSSSNKTYVTLKEYVERMKDDQKEIYYACGESVDKIDMLPQVEIVKEKGYEILYLTDEIDEFTLKAMMSYEEQSFVNVADKKLDLSTQTEKQELEKANESSKDMFLQMSKCLDSVCEIVFTNKLKNHPVCLSSKGEVSIEMQKVLSQMPDGNNIKAQMVLEINLNHPITEKLKKLYDQKETEKLEEYTKVLYAQARLIEGLSIDNPTEISNLVCEMLSK